MTKHRATLMQQVCTPIGTRVADVIANNARGKYIYDISMYTCSQCIGQSSRVFKSIGFDVGLVDERARERKFSHT